MPARTTDVHTGKNKQFIYLFVMPGNPFGCFINLPCSLKSEKRNKEWQKDFVMASEIYCSKGRKISNFTE